MGRRLWVWRRLRVRVAFCVILSDGRRDGTGKLVDFSYTGALIEDSQFQDRSPLPDVGKIVSLCVFVRPDVPIELVGEVVRHSGDQSFALEFKDLSPEVRALVDDAAAIVAAEI